MIVRLPRDLATIGGPIFLPEGDPYLALSSVSGNVYLYSIEGKLVGQILFDGYCATVSICDAPTYFVQKSGAKIDICALPQAGVKARYELFGNASKSAYTLYQYNVGEVLPVVAARVTPEPLDSAYYYADLSEGSNVFRTLLFAVAIARLSRV